MIRSPSDEKGSRGVALLITLLIMVILAVLVHRFTFSTRVHLASAATVRDQFSASCLAISGIEVALRVLQLDDEEGEEEEEAAEEEEADEEEKESEQESASPLPSNADNYAKLQSLSQRVLDIAASVIPDGDGSFTVEFQDESAKIDLNQLIKQDGTPDLFIEAQMRRLLRLFGKPDDEVDALMDPLLDWLDADDDRRPEGAESADYEALKEPYASRNGPLRTLGELTLVRGWEGLRNIRHEDGTALTDCLTVGPTGGRININTAPPLVLQTLNEKIDETVVSEILSRREELAFDDTEDLYVLLNFLTDAERTFITGHIQSQSSLLSLRSEGAYRRVVSRLEVRVVNDDEGYRVIRWRIE